jgi:hypothetical protein
MALSILYLEARVLYDLSCVISTYDGAKSKALCATLFSLFSGTLVPSRVIISCTGADFSNDVVLSNVIRHFGVDVVYSKNISDIDTRLVGLRQIDSKYALILDDDCVPSPDCVRQLWSALSDAGAYGVQGSKIDIVRAAQFGDWDFNWSNEWKPCNSRVYWLDSCCAIVNTLGYIDSTQRAKHLIDASDTVCGDVVVGALYAAGKNCYAFGSAYVQHIPNSVSMRWKSIKDVDDKTLSVLEEVLNKDEWSTFIKSINKLRR